jgi:hypothetical protein
MGMATIAAFNASGEFLPQRSTKSSKNQQEPFLSFLCFLPLCHHSQNNRLLVFFIRRITLLLSRLKVDDSLCHEQVS